MPPSPFKRNSSLEINAKKKEKKYDGPKYNKASVNYKS